MSFFKDFKADFSQAMNELMPGSEPENEEELVVNTLEQEVDAKAELDKLEGLFEKVEAPEPEVTPEVQLKQAVEALARASEAGGNTKPPIQAPAEEEIKGRAAEKIVPEMKAADIAATEAVPEAFRELKEAATEAKSQAAEKIVPETKVPEAAAPVPEKRTEAAAPVPEKRTEAAAPAPEKKTEAAEMKKEEKPKEDKDMNTEEVKETVEETAEVQAKTKEVSEETTIITEGTSLTGNLETTGNMEIRGKVNGNVQCNGKLTVTGVIKGNSSSSEFFADAAKVEGEINTDGTVKIGLGSVVVGNITATSAVIAGAIKGDIDVQGPVVVDTSAVVMGNIKSRSVQINNGAVIEGFCSQSYAEVDMAKLFD